MFLRGLPKKHCPHPALGREQWPSSNLGSLAGTEISWNVFRQTSGIPKSNLEKTLCQQMEMWGFVETVCFYLEVLINGFHVGLLWTSNYHSALSNLYHGSLIRDKPLCVLPSLQSSWREDLGALVPWDVWGDKESLGVQITFVFIKKSLFYSFQD